MAAVVAQLERAKPVAERLVEASGADRGQLRRVAHQQQLALRSVDRVEERGEDARPRHTRLVDNNRCGSRLGDAGGSLELVVGAAARCRPEHYGVDAAIGVGEDA